MRTILLTAALMGLAACGRDEPPAAPSPTEPPEVAAAPAAPPPAAPPPSPSGVSAARLAMVDATGAPVLYLSCANGAGNLLIHAPGLEPIGSEERLTLGAGDEAFAFVADLAAAGPGVTASGAAERDLFVRMSRGDPVSAVYGAHSVGPTRAASAAALADFIARCGELPDR